MQWLPLMGTASPVRTSPGTRHVPSPEIPPGPADAGLAEVEVFVFTERTGLLLPVALLAALTTACIADAKAPRPGAIRALDVAPKAIRSVDGSFVIALVTDAVTVTRKNASIAIGSSVHIDEPVLVGMPSKTGRTRP